MKKLSVLVTFAVLVLASTTTFAQKVKEEIKEVVKEKKELVQDKVEVQLSELPEAVTKTLGEKFSEFTAKKAYKVVKGEKVVYYVKLLKGEEHIKVLVDAKGKVIEKKEKLLDKTEKAKLK